MGRNNKSYSKTLAEQINDRLSAMLKNGEGTSKKADAGKTEGKIYSYSTYHTYLKHCNYFGEWVREKHDCTTLKKAEKYVGEYLKARIDQGLSAYTIRTEAAALCKLFGIKPTDDNYFRAPERSRADIKRSRGDAKRDRNFNPKITKNSELIRFARGTGLRRSELANLKGKDYISREKIDKNIKELSAKEILSPRDQKRLELLTEAVKYFPNKQHFLYTKGKGGRERVIPIVGKDTAEIVEKMRNTPPESKVWLKVNSNADIHSYRGDYATRVYKEYARDLKSIPYDRVNYGTGRKYQSGVYCCRGDAKHTKLDKQAMLIASKALGHNRIEVIARHYLGVSDN